MFIPDPGSKRFQVPDLDPHKRIEVFLTQKIVYKLSEISSGMFIPDPDYGFRVFTYPGSRTLKKATDPGSAILSRSPTKARFEQARLLVINSNKPERK